MYIESTLAHLMLHLFANLGNIVVFSGEYEPLQCPRFLCG
jgi:hypothetical protein